VLKTRDRLWDQTRHALEFFQKHLPFWEMETANELAGGVPDIRVLAKGDELYAVFLPAGGSASLQLGPGVYSVRWYNPRAGGGLQSGSVASARGPGVAAIGAPPAEPDKDWAALVRRVENLRRF